MGSSLCNKEVEIVARQSANHSDSHRYREDWRLAWRRFRPLYCVNELPIRHPPLAVWNFEFLILCWESLTCLFLLLLLRPHLPPLQVVAT